MTERRSAWRANDVVAYEAMRDDADTAIALLLRLSREGAFPASRAHSEAAAIRRQVFEVDGFDRDAVNATRLALEQRISTLSGSLP